MTLYLHSDPLLYLASSDPGREDFASVIQLFCDGEGRLVSSVVALQELSRFFRGQNRGRELERYLQDLRPLLDEIYPLRIEELDRSSLLRHQFGLTLNQSYHVSILQERGVNRIVCDGRGFDIIPGIEEIGLDYLKGWLKDQENRFLDSL